MTVLERLIHWVAGCVTFCFGFDSLQNTCFDQLHVLESVYQLSYLPTAHYANMSVQYTVIFHGCKNNNFQIKNCNIFHIFAQNIYFGYTLEPPH